MKFLDLVKKRYSLRDYSEKKVERKKIELCIESARFAPSACNSQPWFFIVIDDKKIINQIAEKANLFFSLLFTFLYFFLLLFLKKVKLI